MKKKAQSLKINENVEFIGNVKNVEKYLKEADLFVLPLRIEGMSNALLEAMSYGIPCIATNVGANSELLNGEDKIIPLGEYLLTSNGLLVNPDDAEGLSSAILYLIRSHEQRQKMGRQGRDFIKKIILLI